MFEIREVQNRVSKGGMFAHNSTIRLIFWYVKYIITNDFPDLNAVAERLLDFQYYWETTARPFEWKFTRQDLADLLAKTNPPR
jgi:hypothetical protein